MIIMDKWNTLADDQTIQTTIEALKKKQMDAEVVETGADAKQRVIELLPEGANVAVNTSITLDTIGISDLIDSSGKYDSQRKKWMSLDMKTQRREIEVLRSTPEWVIGSTHAITLDGTVITASNSGSNLPSYAYSSDHVIVVVGAQKLVATVDDGMKRIFEYILPLETARARKAYGLPETWESYPSKILLLEREPHPNRIHIIIVKEVLGY